MNPIERNPDLDLDREEVPPGMTIVHGGNLMHTARAKKIPFGVAKMAVQVNHNRRYTARKTVGLVIRDHDVDAFTAALAVKNSHKKKP